MGGLRALVANVFEGAGMASKTMALVVPVVAGTLFLGPAAPLPAKFATFCRALAEHAVGISGRLQHSERRTKVAGDTCFQPPHHLMEAWYSMST